MRSSQGRIAVLLFSLGVAGCGLARPSGWRDRALDLVDVFPVSVGVGRGLAAGVRFTPLIGLGAGLAEDRRFGVDRHRYGPVWWERSRGLPFLYWYRVQDADEAGPTLPSGAPEGTRRARRLVANSYVFVPGVQRRGGVFFLPRIPPYAKETPWEWTDWAPPGSAVFSAEWLQDLLDMEADLFVGAAGVRVGFGPLHAFDFFAGILGFDPESDDPHERPATWPDDDAEPSFPDRGDGPAP